MEYLQQLMNFYLQEKNVNPYFLALLLATGIFSFFIIFRLGMLLFFRHLVKKNPNPWDKLLYQAVKSVKIFFILAAAAYLALRLVEVNLTATRILAKVFVLALTLQLILSINTLIGQAVHLFSRRLDSEIASLVNNTQGVLKVTVWIFGLLFLLGNLGYDTSSLITGLGVGGVAIAFALQSTLADLFSSFSIYLDRPFKNGDLIFFGTEAGNVIKTGFKSTRIRTLNGEELVVSNQNLLSHQIRNFHDIKERRVLARIGLVYESGSGKMQAALDIIRQIISQHPLARFDRAHFCQFGESGLEIEIVYFVLSGELDIYMEVRQQINLALMQKFEEAGIHFAYPTRRLLVENLPGAPNLP